ncbi:MAG: aminotransferase class I/II-fold pyridoxal phosphate-dependent enzyme [Anaerolineae bacterium]|nr:aminotransferase class I/II-fold pyridoxal phosphate-dependent enzyme [Anaerolineae bacterium]
MKISQRVSDLPVYVFAALGKRIKTLQAQGMDIIRMDMGNPDLPAPPEVIETLAQAAQQVDVHGYPGFYGIPEFREAVAAYYARRFSVTLDVQSEILPLIGSKEGIFYVANAFVDPGSVVLIPDPGYPIYRYAAQLVGGEPYFMPLNRENNFLPDFSAIPESVLQRARVMWLNYPNNPTSAVADLDFLRLAVNLARQYNLLIVYDNPYSEVVWDAGLPTPSILQIEGAEEVAIEFNSLSKMANMAGWRVGMAVGNPDALAMLGRVKTNVDSGIFKPVQMAAVKALGISSEWLIERNAIYKRRRDIITGGLNRMRLWFAPYAATLYVWAEIPSRYTSAEFATALLEQAGVSVSPGSAFGPHGEGFVRISIVQPEDLLEDAMERWERWLIGQAMGGMSL